MSTFKKWLEKVEGRLGVLEPHTIQLNKLSTRDLKIALEVNAHLLQFASNAVDLIDRYLRERHPEAELRTADVAIEQLMIKLNAIVERGMKT